jgi:hypothetical protein
MEAEWQVVFTTTHLQKAALLRGMLAGEGIEAMLLNQQDSFYPVIGDIKVLVQSDNVILAKRIISRLEF